MANESTYSVFSDARASEALSGDFLRLLKSRDALPQHPALYKMKSPTIGGSTTGKIPLVGIDAYDGLAATADGADVDNTAMTVNDVTVTVARYSKSYAPTDLAMMTDVQGVLNPARLAQDAIATCAMKLVDLIANLMGGFSNVVGTSGSNLTLVDWLNAIRQLEVSDATGTPLAILHPQQWADLKEDFTLNAGGGIQWHQPTQELISILGNGYKGKLAGVDVFTTTRVPTANAGADRAGGMFVFGGVAWTDAPVTPAVVDPSRQLAIGGTVLFEYDRQARGGKTEFVTHYYVGASEGIDACGVAIITDA